MIKKCIGETDRVSSCVRRQEVTARMASLTLHRHSRCANVLRVPDNATYVQCHVGTVETIVSDPSGQ